MSYVVVDYRLHKDDGSVATLELLLNVTLELDPYGTRDSPTQYNVQFESCISDDNEQYDFSTLHKHDIAKIEKIACDKVRIY